MRQWAASYSANRDAIGRPSWRSSFLGDAGASFFCTGHDVLEILPPPQSALRPKRVTLWATQGFAPTGVAGADHHEVGPNEKIKRGQIKLTESYMGFHPEVPLIAFLRLVHFRIALLLSVLRRGRRMQDRPVHDRTGGDAHSAGLQVEVDRGQNL